MDEKRSQGLCFWCDRKFTPGHKCPNRRQSYAIEVVDDDDEGGQTDGSAELDIPQEEVQDDQLLPHLSVHALTGLPHFYTIRVTASYEGQPISVLIDSGSTHNFLDSTAAARLQCPLTPISSFQVAVADGQTIASAHKVRDFHWRMQGVTFTSDMLILPLGGCEVVLGIQWLVTLGVIQWDFSNLKMEFTSQGKKISLRGSKHVAGTWVKQQRIHKLMEKPAQLNMMALCHIQGAQPPEQETEPALRSPCSLSGPPLNPQATQQLQLLLQEFAGLFVESDGLPPVRGP
ncbi:hypothetical protein KSP39_PZI008722 [Platanthera zijinensis]|uniref:Uncharacterized protein n=1 Tax=Platanthera zijinensis TaxID=2320716 RepID=A0AAP0BLX4_9ASPA